MPVCSFIWRFRSSAVGGPLDSSGLVHGFRTSESKGHEREIRDRILAYHHSYIYIYIHTQILFKTTTYNHILRHRIEIRDLNFHIPCPADVTFCTSSASPV